MRNNSFNSISQSFCKFLLREERGAILVIFAVILIPIMALAGAAIDYSIASSARVQIQTASDTAALAAASAIDSNDLDELQEIAQNVFNDNMQGNDFARNITLTASFIEDGVRVEVSSSVKTTFVRLVGIEELSVNAFSEVTYGAGLLEVALVLDTTASMSGSKISALKNSAKLLVNTIMEDDEGGSVKVGLVPFERHVNIGLENRNEPGINVPADYTDGQDCWQDCDWRRTTSYECLIDGVPSTCWNWESYNCGERICRPRNYKWQGCVGSRDYPLNIQDGGYADEVPGLLTYWNFCLAEPLTRLTNTKATIINGIEAMRARGSTYIPSGLTWGWRILTEKFPFNDGSPKEEGLSKAIVLMTDGSNSRSPTYPWHWARNVDLANDLTAELCENIKNDDIIVYTIAFDVTDPTIEGILENCAGNGGRYFDADNSSELLETFEEIGLSLRDLRLSK